MKFLSFSLIALTLLLFACTEPQAVPQEVAVPSNPLLGAWEMQEVHWKTADTTYSVPEAQFGIFMFSPKRYAIMWTPTEKPRTAFQLLSRPTDEEFIAGFKSVVFNSGSYEMTDSTVTATALIAKVPGFEGGKQFYTYALKENLLRLTMFDETYPSGEKPAWSGRYVTEFVLKKVK